MFLKLRCKVTNLLRIKNDELRIICFQKSLFRLKKLKMQSPLLFLPHRVVKTLKKNRTLTASKVLPLEKVQKIFGSLLTYSYLCPPTKPN